MPPQTHSRSSWIGLLCACLVLCLSLPAHSQQQDLSDEAAVKLAAENFVDVFNNLDFSFAFRISAGKSGGPTVPFDSAFEYECANAGGQCRRQLSSW